MTDDCGSYELVDHTADIGIVLRGQTLQELFKVGARALVETMTGGYGPVCAHQRHVRIETRGLERLLVSWLNELLYLFATERFVVADARFERLDETGLVAVVDGEILSAAQEGGCTELKAATYHGLVVAEEAGGGYSARVVIDT